MMLRTAAAAFRHRRHPSSITTCLLMINERCRSSRFCDFWWQARNFSNSNITTAPSSASSSSSPSRLSHRRKKVFHDRFKQKEEQQQKPLLAKPFDHDEETFEDYSEKASLSPWVPTPDPLARRMLDLAKANGSDIHVELGSGDGRVCFHAMDSPYKVKKSVGIDIDSKLVQTAQERLDRIHPKPDIHFIEADLLDFDNPAWNHVKEASIITMYFTEEALQRIRPQLEKCIANRKVRVVCCGYAMPKWEPEWVEVLLGLKLFSYHWGITSEDEDEMIAASSMNQHHEENVISGEIHEQEDLEEVAFPALAREFREAERIEVPYIDPEEMIDGHWDDFDDEEDDWKPPEQ